MNALNVGNGLTADVVSVSELSAIGGIEAGQFSGNGSGLTNLNAANVTTGTIADARLSTNSTLNGPLEQYLCWPQALRGWSNGHGLGLRTKRQ